MTKQKNIDLPPSGMNGDALGVSGEPEKKKKVSPRRRGCNTLLLIVLTLGIGIFIATPSSKPPAPTPTPSYAAVTVEATRKATVTPWEATEGPSQTPTRVNLALEEASLKELPAVDSVDYVSRVGTDYVARVKTWPKFNKESFADLLHIQAIHVDPHIIRFAVQIDDGESEPLWWVYDEDLEWSSRKQPPLWADLPRATATPAPARLTAPRATSVPAGEAEAAVKPARPANCDEAVAMGLTAEQAAQWSHLDRDGDGVACYGD